MHSQDPISNDKNIVYCELACGQGETLASANQAGTPFRIQFNKSTNEVSIVTFSNYSFGLYASQSAQDLAKKCLDYTEVPLTADPT